MPRRQGIEVVGNAQFPVNKGGLCVKGWSAAATLGHPDRLRTPLVATRSGAWCRRAGMRRSIAIARRFEDVQARYGRDAVGVFGGGSLTNEKAYLLGKFARVALGTANIDYNGRFCMSSAAAAAIEGVRHRSRPAVSARRHRRARRSILLVGGNVAETMPPIMRYFEAQQRQRRQADRGRSAATRRPRSGRRCTPLSPGSDAALANGLLHILMRDGLIDHDYIRERTEGFDEVRRVVAALLAGARRAHHRRARSGARRSGAACSGTAPQRDGPHRARPRAAGAGRRTTRSPTSTSRSRSEPWASRSAATAR